MGIERQQDNGLLFLTGAMVNTCEQEAFAAPKVKKWNYQNMRGLRTTIEGDNLDWLYLNYADKSQVSLWSYGAENMKKMKGGAAGYDPKEVWRTLCPGGFKISTVMDVERNQKKCT